MAKTRSQYKKDESEGNSEEKEPTNTKKNKDNVRMWAKAWEDIFEDENDFEAFLSTFIK